MSVINERYIEYIVMSILGANLLYIQPNDKLEIINQNGILACLIRETGAEYWWCDDGACYFRLRGADDHMIRNIDLDILYDSVDDSKQ